LTGHFRYPAVAARAGDDLRGLVRDGRCGRRRGLCRRADAVIRVRRPTRPPTARLEIGSVAKAMTATLRCLLPTACCAWIMGGLVSCGERHWRDHPAATGYPHLCGSSGGAECRIRGWQSRPRRPGWQGRDPHKARARPASSAIERFTSRAREAVRNLPDTNTNAGIMGRCAEHLLLALCEQPHALTASGAAHISLIRSVGNNWRSPELGAPPGSMAFP